ncbi:MAG: RtcB family protein, partial [Nitrospinota bacterium]
RMGKGDRRRLAEQGARFAAERGFGDESWLSHLEAEGRLPGGDPERVSERAWSRGSVQLGSLGSGNHFLEIQVVEEIYQPEVADAYGLFGGQVCVMIHTGSRGLGHQVCTDFLADMDRTLQRYKIQLPDRQLACAPLSSPEARDYWAAMTCAANFAWANRQCIAGRVAEVFGRVLDLSPRDLGMSTVYDVAHNIVKVEEYEVNGERLRLAVHRKGATRAFPPGHPEVPEAYRKVGQPVLIPGDMGRFSYVLAGAEGSMRLSFGSTCHGAGRALSRKAAMRAARGRSIFRELEAKGIYLQARGRGTVAEEMSEAYKDAAQVVDVVERAGLSRTVAKMHPVGVMKG